MKKKILSLMLCVIMAVSILPDGAIASAADDGIYTVTGIVVGNENYSITKDANGHTIVTGYNNGNPVYATSNSLKGSEKESVIYCVYNDPDNGACTRLLTIPVALSDDLLGCEVTVRFRANQTADKWFSGVELVGDVKVTKNTVVYEVPALDVKLYPDGNSTSTTPVYPSINFKTADGEEIKIETKVARVGKYVDIQETGAAAIFTEFGNYAWVSDATYRGYGWGLYSDPVRSDDFFQDMGTPALTSYRFVSVDGGKTFSYIFKMVADDGSNINYGAITGLSYSKNSITIAGLGTRPLDEVACEGELAKGDLVVYYFENGYINIVKAEAVTEEIESLNDDGSVVIGGKTYYLWRNAYQDTALDLYSDDTLASYIVRNPWVLDPEIVYYTYDNLILSFEKKAVPVNVGEYAVITKTTYDEDLDVAYVTLGHVDNTQETYEVGKLNIENTSNTYDEKNDKASDFANNTYFGMVVKFKVMENGKLDLSANDLGYTSGKQTVLGSKAYSDTAFYSSSRYDKGIMTVTAGEGELSVDGRSFCSIDENSVIFVLYGNPQYYNNGGNFETLSDVNYIPVKAVAYTLNEKREQQMGTIPGMLIDTVYDSAYAFSYVLNTTKGIDKGIIAAAMTIGNSESADTGVASGVKDTSISAPELSLIVSAKNKYDVSTRKIYREFELLNEDGLVTLRTADGVSDFENNEIDLGEMLGNAYGGYHDEDDDGVYECTDGYVAGVFVCYKLDKDGMISHMDCELHKNASNSYKGEQSGLFLVNAMLERNGKLFFLPADRNYIGSDVIANATFCGLNFHDGGHEVISVDYAGKDIAKVSTRKDNLYDGIGNAVIQVDEGRIVRVFSFAEGFTVDMSGGGRINVDEGDDEEPDAVAVTGIALDKKSVTLEIGDKTTLAATVSPSYATNPAVEWTSSDEAVATVADGTVTAIGAGTAIVTVTTSDGGYTATCLVKVLGKTTPDDPEAADVVITVGSNVAAAGAEITVPVTISGNTGLSGLQLQCEYPDELILTGATAGTALSGLTFTPSGDFNDKPVTILWDGERADATNGRIASLTFKISEKATVGDKYEVSFNVKVACDDDVRDVPVKVEAGSVTVSRYTPGDVSNDGKVDTKDIIYTRRYAAGGYTLDIVEDAADVDASGKVDSKDIILMRRYIAGGYGVVLK